jgi:regulatory protein
MKGIITAITPQEKNAKRVNVFIDGNFAFGLDGMLAAMLYVGKPLSEEEISELLAEDEKTKAYQKAIRYIGIRPRTIAELRHYLQSKSFSEKVILETIEKCLSQQLIEDDERFATNYIESRFQNHPMGGRKLFYELKRLGISEEVIEQKTKDLMPNEKEYARQTIQKLIKRYYGLDKQKFSFRLSQALLRRGFSYDVVREVVQEAWQEVQ